MRELERYKAVIAEPIDGLDDTFRVLRELGCRVAVGPPVSCAGQRFSEDELIELCADADAYFGMSREQVTERLLCSCPKLRVVCKYGTGVNNIDVAAATRLGILVTNTPVHSVAVAEFAIADMLALLRRLPNTIDHLRAGGWRDASTVGHELSGRTVGIVGFGAIGKQVARRLQGWDVELLAYSPRLTREEAALHHVRQTDWDTLFSASDIVTLHLPLRTETAGIVGRRELALMKSTAILVNTARGGVVDQEALTEALAERRIAGAGLDVYAEEQLDAQSPLRRMDNVILTPHIAGYTGESLRRISRQATANCLRALRGERPDFVVNPAAVKRWSARFSPDAREI